MVGRAMYGMMIATRGAELAELEALPHDAFVARVFGGVAAKTNAPLIENHERTLHLETLWAAVDFVLTGKTLAVAVETPLAFLRPTSSFSDQAIGPDLGRGPARVLSAERVRVIAAALGRLDDATLTARVTSPELAHVVPFSNADEDDELLALAHKSIASTMGKMDLENAEPTTAEELVGRIKPRRRDRPTPNERADIREAIDELRAFLGKLVRAGDGALVVVA